MRFTTEAASLNTCNKHFIVTKTRYTKKKSASVVWDIKHHNLATTVLHTTHGRWCVWSLVAFVAILAGFMCLMGLYWLLSGCGSNLVSQEADFRPNDDERNPFLHMLLKASNYLWIKPIFNSYPISSYISNFTLQTVSSIILISYFIWQSADNLRLWL
jgi:hypothetical protein